MTKNTIPPSSALNISLDRRAVLRQLVAGGLVLGAPVLGAAAPCKGGPSPATTQGPFAPQAVHPRQGQHDNPGEIVKIGETDLDLTVIKGGAPHAVEGRLVWLGARVVDENCQPIKGAHIAMWQADANGHYNHRNEGKGVTAQMLSPGFAYWGHGESGKQGQFGVRSIVPGSYAATREWTRPPHMHWTISAPGFKTLTTQTYFAGDIPMAAEVAKLNAADPILNFKAGFAASSGAMSPAEARQRTLRDLVATITDQEVGGIGSLRFVLTKG